MGAKNGQEWARNGPGMGTRRCEGGQIGDDDTHIHGSARGSASTSGQDRELGIVGHGRPCQARTLMVCE